MGKNDDNKKRKNKIFKVILYCIIAALIVGIIAIGIVYSLKSKKDETEINKTNG